MVGERRADTDSQFLSPKLAAGFVGLVSLSSVTMAATGGATLPQTAFVGVLGAVVGAGLLLAIGVKPWEW